MTKKTKIIIGIASIAAGIAAIFLSYKLLKHKIKTVDEAIKVLLSANNSRDKEKLKTFDNEYLIAWAQATIDKKDKFKFRGKLYYTSNGRAAQ
jgi:uncharacterized membrane protein YvbJ